MAKSTSAPLSLFETQQTFSRAIKGYQDEREQLASAVVEKPPISALDRIEVYQEAYSIRILEAMREDFKRVLEKVGEETFDQLAWKYILRHPSHYANLAEIGQNFAEFLKAQPVLSELARMDWLEILAGSSQLIPGHALDFEQLGAMLANGEGHGIRVCRAPSTFIETIGDHIFLACRAGGGVNLVRIESKAADLMGALNPPATLESIAERAADLGLSPEALQGLLADWMREEAIYCEMVAN